MDNGPDDNNPRNARLRVNLNVHNPLIGLRSTRFSLSDKMAESNGNGNVSGTTNGKVSLKKVQFNVDLEQNYSNLKASLSERNTEVKKQHIFGPTGTVRGFKNIIKERQMNFDKLVESEVDNGEGEDGIVFYSTTMGGIRSTVEDCRFVRRIFQNHRLRVDERDIFMEKKYQLELDRRLKTDGAQVPQIFVNSVWLGGKREIMELNETGRLMKLLSEFERHNGEVCQTCGGFNFINCTACNGSKASRRTRISREMSVLKCTVCNENGLVRCSNCSLSPKTQNGTTTLE